MWRPGLSKYIHIWKDKQARFVLPTVEYSDRTLYALWNEDFFDIYREWHEDRYLLFFKRYPEDNIVVPFTWKHKFYEVHSEHDRLH